ncbi:MAG: hypothetical protein J7484_06000, partial [Microbacterium sp.]|nr:hypothetical protein [Microbacterium sp.]
RLTWPPTPHLAGVTQVRPRRAGGAWADADDADDPQADADDAAEAGDAALTVDFGSTRIVGQRQELSLKTGETWFLAAKLCGR